MSNKFKFQILDAQSSYLEKVIELGDQNSKTLGFFSRGAFIVNAEKGWIVICISVSEHGEELAGYLMYRIKSRLQEVSITHLCIAPQYRNKDLAKHLFDFLKEKTQHFYGVSLYCRRDYNLDNFWKKLGFNPVAEKQGRGVDKEPLTYWYHTYGHLDLLKLLAQKSTGQKYLIVVLDANVFFDFYLNDSSEGSQESQALKADWLNEDQELFLTEEIYDEINRNPDTEERKNWKKKVLNFQILPSNQSIYQEVYDSLRPLFPEKLTQNSGSDLEHLVLSITGDAGFFITRDEEILALASTIKDLWELEIMHPSDYISHLDEFYNRNDYNTERLSGTNISRDRIKANQKDLLITTFLNYKSGEKKSHLKMLVNNLLANPQSVDFRLISQQERKDGNEKIDKPLFCIAYREIDNCTLEIPIFRMRKSRISDTLVKHLVLEIILNAAYTYNKYLIRITDKNISQDIKKSLLLDYFGETDDEFIRVVFPFVGKRQKFCDFVRNFKQSKTKTPIKSILDNLEILNSLEFESNSMTSSVKLISEIEKSLYPVKILDEGIPNYVIPIQPEWAKRLFDEGLANQELFNVDPVLALRREVVYYCTAKNIGQIQNLEGIGRILWYVSLNNTYPKIQYHGIQSVRACSRLDEVLVDTPEKLYKQFSRLGVYELNDIKKLVSRNDQERKVMALKFSDTERFSVPVSFDKIKKILASTAPIQSPRRINDSAFEKIYCEGLALRSEM